MGHDQSRKIVQCSRIRTRMGHDQSRKIVQCSRIRTRMGHDQSRKIVQCSRIRTRMGHDQSRKIVQCSRIQQIIVDTMQNGRRVDRNLSFIGHTITEFLNNIAHSLENKNERKRQKIYKVDRVYDSNNVH